MFQPQAYFTFWIIAERWAAETGQDVMDIVMTMRKAATYPEIEPMDPILLDPEVELPPESFDERMMNKKETRLLPPLVVRPVAFLSPAGLISRNSVFTACTMQKTVDKRGDVIYESRLYSAEYKAAVEFLNSATIPHHPTDDIKNRLSLFAILREDFKNWCQREKFPLPKFWFGSQDGAPSTLVFEPVPPPPESVGEIEIPILHAEVEPPKQYPCRIDSDQNETVEEYIKRRRNNKPPASDEDLVYELRGELQNGKIGELLDIGVPGPARKTKVQRMFKSAADKRGTTDLVIKGRRETTVTPVTKFDDTP